MTDREPTDDAELAALYREGDADLEPPAGLRSVRDLIGAARASGFDEEPPAHLDALLLAAARRHAPAPRRPWWRRAGEWLRPVVLHPALAAGMALLAVGVAAGVMYDRGRVQVAQPSVRPPAVTPQRQAPVEPSGAAGVLAGDGATAPVDEIARTDEAAPKRELEARPVEAPPAGPRRPPAPAGGAGTKARDTDEAAPAAGGVGRAGPGAAAELAEVAEDSAPPAPPAPERDPVAPVEERQAANAPVTQLPEPARPGGDLREDLLREAQVAARRGDCAAVRTVAKKAAALDPAFYRVAFERDRDVAPCLAGPSK